MESLNVIGKVADKIAPGRTPFFSEAQTIKALEIADTMFVGRIRMSRELGLSEGMTRTLMLGSNDLDRIPIVQDRIQGYDLAVHPGSHTVNPHFRMNLESHIDWRGSHG